MIIENWLTSDISNNKAVYFRRKFSVEQCKKAVLKISALGWVKVFVNGRLVTEDEFLPGWTDYNKRVLLFSYDITNLLKADNVIGAVVGNGWARGTELFGELKKYYNISAPCLYARIEWSDEQGNSHIIGDDGWKFGFGAIVENDIMMGETQNYRVNCEGFSEIEFDESKWKPAQYLVRPLFADETVLPRVSVHEIFKGREISKGLYDFGQNFAGVVRFSVKVFEEAEIKIRHGEILGETGKLSVENLRTAEATDRYILPKGEYVLRPWFTYHGFRYAEFSVKGKVELLSCEGLAIYTNSPIIGQFYTSSILVNNIYSNCV